MHLHSARLPARSASGGGLLLLEEQDRTQWDAQQIHTGMAWLAKSAHGDVYSRFHAEAAVAAEHCRAPSFNETNWARVADGYAMLERVAPSPLHRLNRALAVAEWRDANAGLQVLKDFAPPEWPLRSYMWWAVLSDLHRRAGDAEVAERHRETAVSGAPTEAIRVLLERRLRRAR
jgi:RNA polymerase sigma-70 factor (ECF subfamily)